MNWLFPGFLLGALGVAIPLALHLLRRYPPRTVVFPSLMFLAVKGRELEHRWHRLRRWLVLLLRCAVFALLAAIFARPYFTGRQGHSARAIVVVVDNTFSVQAKDRWTGLHRWVRDRIGTLAPGDRLGVLLMAPQPAWLVPLTGEFARPLQALDELPPGWLTGRAEPALRFAGEILANASADSREIIFFGDHQRLSWAGTDFNRPLPAGVTAIFPDPAKSVMRQAALQTPRLALENRALTAWLTIRNFTGPQRRVLRAYVNGGAEPLQEQTIELAADEVRSVRVPLTGVAERGGWFRFALEGDDLPADDTVYATWQPAHDRTLLLDPMPSGSRTDFIAGAFQAAANSTPSFKIAPLPAEAWPATAVAVLRNDATFAGDSGTKLDTFLSAGGEAIIFASDGENEKAWLARHQVEATMRPVGSERWRVEHWTMDHPLVMEFSRHRLDDLLGWEFTHGWGFPANSVQPLAFWSGSQENPIAAVAELRVGAGSALLLGFGADRESGDWPVTPAFVPFLHRAATFLMYAGEKARVGEAGRAVDLEGKTGRWQSIEIPVLAKVDADVTGFVTPTIPGIYRFTSGSNATLFAVNVPPEESDPAIWSVGTPWKQLISTRPRADRPQEDGIELAAAESEEKTSLWWWAAVGALAFLLVEVALANRTAR